VKLLFENWRQYLLAEKLLLKPGSTGWDLYGKLVANPILKGIKHTQVCP